MSDDEFRRTAIQLMNKTMDDIKDKLVQTANPSSYQDEYPLDVPFSLSSERIKLTKYGTPSTGGYNTYIKDSLDYIKIPLYEQESDESDPRKSVFPKALEAVDMRYGSEEFKKQLCEKYGIRCLPAQLVYQSFVKIPKNPELDLDDDMPARNHRRYMPNYIVPKVVFDNKSTHTANSTLRSIDNQPAGNARVPTIIGIMDQEREMLGKLVNAKSIEEVKELIPFLSTIQYEIMIDRVVVNKQPNSKTGKYTYTLSGFLTKIQVEQHKHQKLRGFDL